MRARQASPAHRLGQVGSLGDGGVQGRGDLSGGCAGGDRAAPQVRARACGQTEEGGVLGLPPTGSVWATHRSFLGCGTNLRVKGDNRTPSRGCEDSGRRGLAHSVHFVPRVQPVRGLQTQFNEEG